MLRLYYGDVSLMDPRADIYPLSDYRREKLRTLRLPAARRLGIGAELLLRSALADCAPEAVWPPEIRCGPYGRPEWEIPGLCFSLSHSGAYAACAIADSPIGLDIQTETRFDERLARRCFSDAEREELLAAPDRDRGFGRIWTMKESYLKAVGTGLHTPLRSFSVAGDGRALAGARIWYRFDEGLHWAICVLDSASAQPDRIIRKDFSAYGEKP